MELRWRVDWCGRRPVRLAGFLSRLVEMSSASLKVPAQARSDEHGNIDSLTGVRFVAALTIALGHSYAPVDVITMVGMPLFFTLSGFIIHYVYSDTFAAGWRSAVGKFATARFSRIYPLYFILLLVALALTPMGKFIYLNNIYIIAPYLLACYTWFPLVIDGHMAADWYYSISWSVPTEIFFYIAYALGLYKLHRINNDKLCLVILVGFCAFSYLLFYGFFLTRDFWGDFGIRHIGFSPWTTDFGNSLYRWFLYTSPYGRIFEFIGGCITCQLFLLVRKNNKLRSRANIEILAWLPCILIAVMVILYQSIAPYHHWLAPHDHRFLSYFVSLHMNFLLAPLCYLLIFSLAYGKSTLSRILSTSTVVLLGEISYSTYLGHPLAQSFWDNSALSHVPYLSKAIEIVLIYIFSWMFYSSLEVPAKSGLRRFFALRPGQAIVGCLGPGGAWVTAIAAIALLGAIFVPMLAGKEKTKAAALAAPATLGDLPPLPLTDGRRVVWDGTEGLAVRRLDAPAVTSESPLSLVVTTETGRHRLGVSIHGIDSNQPFRVSAWLKVASPINILLDLRDDKATHHGTAVFRLPDGTNAQESGNLTAFGRTAEPDGWVRVWADMIFTGDVVVAYVTLLDPSDKNEFSGDGRTGISFGGIDVRRP
jgi:peptidoglycan/LPS O-acetylase OafA/YrhL